jgi:O-antigen/teichoic acid export membrane protein
MTLISFLYPLADLGSSTHLMRETPRASREEANRLLSDVLAVRVPIIIVTALVGVLAGYVLLDDDKAMLLVLILIPNLAMQALSASLGASLRGLNEMGAVAWIDSLSRALSLIMVAALLIGGFGVVPVTASSNVVALVALLIGVFFIVRRIGLPRVVQPQRWSQLVMSGLPFFVSQAAVAFHGRIDVIILSRLTDVTVAGWYTAAYSVITIPIFLPSIICGAFFPTVAALARTDPEQLARLTKRCIQLVLLGTLPMALGISIMSSEIVDVLGYREEFGRAVPLITILSLHMPVVAVNMVLATAVYAVDHEKRWMKLMVVATVLDVGLNFMFIPVADAAWGNGAIASAIITVSTEVFVFGAGLFLVPAGILDRRTLSNSVRCLFAAGAMVAVVFPLQHSFVLVPVIFGGITYVIAAFAFGAVQVADLKAISGYVRRRASRSVPVVDGTSSEAKPATAQVGL